MQGAYLLAACGVLASVICPKSKAAGSSEFEAQLKQARDLYYQGTYGNKEAAQRSQKLFSMLREEAPNDPRVKAYYGSEQLLEASRSWAVWKKYSLSKQGIELMDAAVAQAPEDLEIRFVRAVTTYHLPSFFERKKQSEEDFQYLSSRVAAAARNGKLDSGIAASALLFYGRICKEQSHIAQAASAWKTATELAPASKAGRDAALELAKMAG